jgi:hypothetical protein
MAGKPWSKDEEAKLVDLCGKGWSDGEIAGVMSDRGMHAIRQKRSGMGLDAGMVARHASRQREAATMTRVISETGERTIIAPEEADEEPFDELLQRAISQTNRDRKKALARRFCIAEIVTQKPIGITFKSDQHLTMHGPCDVERAFRDAEIVQQVPGMFALLGGDGVDNHIKHRAAMVGKGSRPTDEYRLYDGYLRTLGHKVLAMISGNHDDWTKDNSGVDMVGILASRHRIHFAPDVVVMTIRLVPEPGAEPSAEYVVKMRHQYRFNSSLNVGHAVKRMWDMDGDDFDIGVVCHNHEAHSEVFNRHGQTRVALRPGSYQVESSFSRRIGFDQSYPTCPGVVLWPGERRLEAFHDLRGLAEKLASVR